MKTHARADSNVNEEIKDTLMGHLRESAKSSYSLSVASVVRIYHEEIFPKLAVNGWSLKQKASEVDELAKSIDDLKTALSQLEAENIVYKTRIDNIQTSMVDMESKFSETEEILRNAIGSLWEKAYGFSDFSQLKVVDAEEGFDE